MVAPRIWQCIVEKCTKREKIHQNEKKYAKTREEMSQKQETKLPRKTMRKMHLIFPALDLNVSYITITKPVLNMLIFCSQLLFAPLFENEHLQRTPAMFLRA